MGFLLDPRICFRGGSLCSAQSRKNTSLSLSAVIHGKEPCPSAGGFWKFNVGIESLEACNIWEKVGDSQACHPICIGENGQGSWDAENRSWVAAADCGMCYVAPISCTWTIWVRHEGKYEVERSQILSPEREAGRFQHIYRPLPQLKLISQPMHPLGDSMGSNPSWIDRGSLFDFGERWKSEVNQCCWSCSLIRQAEGSDVLFESGFVRLVGWEFGQTVAAAFEARI